jgi:hypothetical protein
VQTSEHPSTHKALGGVPKVWKYLMKMEPRYLMKMEPKYLMKMEPRDANEDGTKGCASFKNIQDSNLVLR